MTGPIDPGWRPDTGSMRHEFRFDPLHYGSGGEQQAAFKRRMRDELQQYGFILTDEVAITWRLLVDEQARWESDIGADVDNFAKLLNDGLCGPGGIIIDDVQVQSLHVSWIDATESSFELQVECGPDDGLTRPLSLYQLADDLWHPLPDSVRANPEHAAHLLYALDNRVFFVRRLRHLLRQRGLPARAAYEAAQNYAVISRGFHSTRAASNGFPRVRRHAWMAQYTRPTELPEVTGDEIERAAATTAAHYGYGA
ncbi:RusA family crossover junction endodeoxyribonuclease [Blastococcus saxobsidens]|uniref:RusA family crossover junction endodeoxyribonuclease n=1 Tax=Blastococcus saxobsidens TaxID=138336 RepID=A0A6L9W802_9ACTN|nr:RusA family crossover junction endodeoxyribonuclease [Blastococcus saxobsidens]NEK87949.1 RusA family crossover junction endodeoxyribonuclease [Blastococcus saxobsidens]